MRLKLQTSWPFFDFRTRFKPHHDLVRLLPAELLAEVTVDASKPDSDVPEGRLADIWNRVGKSHRWHHYFPIFERAFGELSNKAVRFLEIGVQEGGSLRMWKEFFGADAIVVGIDIDPSCRQHENPHAGIYVRIGSQADPIFLARVAQELGPFDVILDDGSHVISHMVTSFGHLYGAGLRPGGAYVVEDTHATYWEQHRDLPYTFSDFCRDLTDLMHAAYWHSSGSQRFSLGSPERLQRLKLPALATQIESIHIYDSVAVIRKARVPSHLPVNSRPEVSDPASPRATRRCNSDGSEGPTKRTGVQNAL